MTQQEMWLRCKEKAKEGKDINQGGLGRVKYNGKVYVGGFFLNVVMFYRPEESLLRFNGQGTFPTKPFELTDSEFAVYINR